MYTCCHSSVDLPPRTVSSIQWQTSSTSLRTTTTILTLSPSSLWTLTSRKNASVSVSTVVSTPMVDLRILCPPTIWRRWYARLIIAFSLLKSNQRLNHHHGALHELFGSHFFGPVVQTLHREPGTHPPKIVDFFTGTGLWLVATPGYIASQTHLLFL